MSGKTVAELVAEVEKAVRPLGFKIRRAADSREQPGIAEMEITLVAKREGEDCYSPRCASGSEAVQDPHGMLDWNPKKGRHANIQP